MSEKSVSAKFYKTCWMMCLVVSSFGFLFYASKLFDKWKISPDIIVTINQKPAKDIPLPALTFCDSIYPEEIQIEQHIITYLTNKKLKRDQRPLTSIEQNYLAVAMQICGPQQLVKYAEGVCSNRTDKDIVKLLNEAKRMTYSYNCEFRDYSLGGCQRVLTKSLTDYGICHTVNLNDYNQLFNPSTLSQDFDIFKRKSIAKFPDHQSILFNTDADDDVNWTLEGGYSTSVDEVLPIRALKNNKFGIEFCYTIENARNPAMNFCPYHGNGYKIIFHMPNEIPTIFHHEQFVEFGYEKFFTLNAKVRKTSSELRKFSPDKRKCYFEGEKQLKFFRSYSKKLCEYECVTNNTLEQCGCVKFSMPRERDTKICDLDKVECFSRLMRLWPFQNSEDEKINDCDCYNACNEIEYLVNYNRIIKDIVIVGNVTHTYFTFEFKSHFIEEHESIVMYSFSNFLADLGGLIGLFLGVSCMSIMDLMQKSLDSRSNNNSKNDLNNVENNQVHAMK